MGTKFSTTPLAGYTNTKFPALSDETAKGHVTPTGMRAAINVEDGADVTDATNVQAAGAAMTTNDLSDLNDAATARTNLGLGSAATTATTAYATAAQGAKADAALPASSTSDDITEGSTNLFMKVAERGAVGVIPVGLVDDATTDNQAILSAAFAAASAGEKIVLPPCSSGYAFSGKLVIPPQVHFDMRGARLIATSTDETDAALTIGSAATGSSDLNLLGLWIDAQGVTSTVLENEAYIGVKLVNITNSHIDVRFSRKFTIGVQCYAGDGGRFAYNEIHLGQLIYNRFDLDLRGSTNEGWCNENEFHGGNYAKSSSFNKRGSAFGVRFSTDSGGYAGQNNNVFYKPCFQVGATTGYQWAASTAVASGDRLESGGGEYRIFTTGTTGATAPTHTTGTVTLDGIDYEYLGDYRRSPVLFDGAGSYACIHGARWESGQGGFAYCKTEHGNFLDAQVMKKLNVTNMGNSSDIEDVIVATSVGVDCHKTLRLYGHVDAAVTSISDVHKKAVGSASGWMLPNFHGGNSSMNPYSDSLSASGVLCEQGIYFDASSPSPCVCLDARLQKRFRITPHSHNIAGRVRFKGLSRPVADSTYLLDVDDTNRNIVGQGLYAASTMAIRSADTHDGTTFVAGDDVDYVLITIYGCDFSGITIQPVPDKADLRQHGAHMVNLYANDDSTRYSKGTPTKGFFTQLNERIKDVSGSTEWRVTTRGAMAPAWATGVAVVRGELRENGGHIYSADEAGTTGATAPTHSSGAVSDGTITWTRILPKAALTVV